MNLKSMWDSNFTYIIVCVQVVFSWLLCAFSYMFRIHAPHHIRKTSFPNFQISKSEISIFKNVTMKPFSRSNSVLIHLYTNTMQHCHNIAIGGTSLNHEYDQKTHPADDYSMKTEQTGMETFKPLVSVEQESHRKKIRGMPPPLPTTTTCPVLNENKTTKRTTKKRNKEKNEAIATKYPKKITDVLMTWMIGHVEHPYPSQVDIEELMQKTGLNQSQVVNWTTNVRKRNIKATIEGKKPHHFLDFLALIHERDRKRNQEQQQGGESICKCHDLSPNPATKHVAKNNTELLDQNQCATTNMFEEIGWNMPRATHCGHTFVQDTQQGNLHWKEDYNGIEVGSSNNNTCFHEQVTYGNNGCLVDEYPIDLVCFDASGIFEQHEIEHQSQDLDEFSGKMNADLFDWKDSNCHVDLTNFRWFQEDEEMEPPPLLIDDLSRVDSLALFSMANESIVSANDSIQMDPDFVSEFLSDDDDDDDKSTSSLKFVLLMDAEIKPEFMMVDDTY